MFKKIMKVVGKILLVLLIIIALIAILVSIRASKNMKSMNKCVDDTISALSSRYQLTEVSCGEYQEMKAAGVMKFHVKQYDIDGIGNLSVMTVNVAMMQMATFVITPFEKDIPLLSCDYMYILKNRKAYIEIYDLVNNKDSLYDEWLTKYADIRASYADLEDVVPTSAWYDSLVTVGTYKAGKPDNDGELGQLLLDMVDVYLDQADSYSDMTEEEKVSKVKIEKTYSDRLIDEGGISTDFFKKSFGADVTRDFFDKVFFGTKR